MNIFSLLKFIALHPLNRSGRAKALLRFFRWQLGSRALGMPVALPYAGGTSLVCEKGMVGATQNYYCGLHEPNEMGFLLHYLRSDELFVDIGANVGTYTVLAAGVVGASVISIEPIPKTFSRLQRNIRYNDLLAEAHCIGISSQAGVLHFTDGLDAMNRVALEHESIQKVTVPVRTLDEICDDRDPAVIKIDVEGHELAVLNGATSILSSKTLNVVIMETNESGALFGVSDDQLVVVMAKFGFTCCKYEPLARKLVESSKGNANSIFVKDINLAQIRCLSAPRFALINGSI
jgi:FkbM family methyltransferase